jgi:hypothetical protein
MQATFTDLVGTAVVPAHSFDSSELTDLTPALDTATAIHGMAVQASEANYNSGPTYPPMCFGLQLRVRQLND